MRKTVLALACILLAPIFLVGITASAPYEPWYDLDENGKIDIFDIVRMVGTYGTTGDPGKNVNVTNFPLDEQGNLLVSIAEKTLTLHTEAVEIAVVTTEISGAAGGPGILLLNDTWTTFPYVFNPREQLVSVDFAVIEVVYNSPYTVGGDYYLELNWMDETYVMMTDNPTPYAIARSILPSYIPPYGAGIYYMNLKYTDHNPGIDFWLLELTLFIQYQYLA